ncbi:short-chain fatty acid transporter [Halobium salinum]|uniref:Short-chain fatty acid transporter n=1 Tax=Halobium salinum TaxID=1364940 RepID=A0ABD5P8X6_9EURY|nr:TIGR00366 family protein [Halobium salinum]
MGRSSSIASSNVVSRFFTRLGDVASRVVQRYLPDAFIFALLLTLATMVLAVGLTPKGPADVARHWSDGFWFVLTFSMQSSLALITGWVFADSPPVKRVLGRIANVPESQFQAVFVTALVGQLLGLFHWGVVLIGSAILAREIGIAMDRKDIDVHYPLLVAAGYAGLLPWHQGLSAASSLLVATEGHLFAGEIGVVPVSQTIFHPANLLIVAAVVLTTVLVMPMMTPDRRENIVTVPQSKLREAGTMMADGGAASRSDDLRSSSLRDALLDTPLLGGGVGLLIGAYLVYLLATNPFMQVFNLNVFISFLFALGLLFHWRLRSYVDVLRRAVEGASQIMIQFQFYGGIMGIMAWSGLAELIASTFAAQATSTTWYLFTFLAAGIVNFFVPSGGGQWVVTGQVLIDATQQIPGANQNLMIVAFGMGDQWTNMIQPFWAIPVLSIAGLSIRDMMGYAAVLFVFSGLVMGAGALLMGVVY